MDDGSLTVSDSVNKEAWKCHNVENSQEESLPNVDPIEGPAIWIDSSIEDKAMKDMKMGKASGPSGLTVEMLLSGGVGYDLVTHIVKWVVQKGVIPND